MNYSPPVELIIRRGTVVDSAWQGRADVLIAEGRVLALVEPDSWSPRDGTAPVEVDALGSLVMPGGVDPHCHVGFTSGDFTTRDDYLQCTTAAVFGGTTTIVDFAIPRAGQTPLEAAHQQRAKATGGLCDSALHACVVEWDSTTAEQLRALTCDGIVTVKIFTTYSGETMANPETIFRTMNVLKDLGGMVVAHCEANHVIEDAQSACVAGDATGAWNMSASRPEVAETASVAEVLAMAESIDAPIYFVHQSTSEAVELVAAARLRGVRAFSEVVAHHLLLDDSEYDGETPERFVCCPPLRPAESVRQLGRQLFNGQVSTLGSDHCCYDLAQKEVRRDDVRAMPNGLPGVETRLPVLFSEFVIEQGLPASRFVELTAANPARLNGLFPRKGSLLPGADADIAIWNPAERWSVASAALHQATDYSPYEGRSMTGRPRTVIVGGRVIVDEGRLVDGTPRGRHLIGSRLDLPSHTRPKIAELP